MATVYSAQERYYILPVAITRRLLIEGGGAMFYEYRCSRCGVTWARGEEEPIISVPYAFMSISCHSKREIQGQVAMSAIE